MKIKTDELIGKALDWAVAKCNGEDETYVLAPDQFVLLQNENRSGLYCYSADWSQGGPIIEREKYNAPVWDGLWQQWRCPDPKNAALGILGPTPLVAAMRCFVCARIGKEVDVPDELLTASEVATESAAPEPTLSPQRPRGG